MPSTPTETNAYLRFLRDAALKQKPFQQQQIDRPSVPRLAASQHRPNRRLSLQSADMSAAGAREFAQKARNASRKLQALPTEERVAMLNRVADALLANEEVIMAENKKVYNVCDRVNQHPCALIACQPEQQ
jgi:hypothetical protein